MAHNANRADTRQRGTARGSVAHSGVAWLVAALRQLGMSRGMGKSRSSQTVAPASYSWTPPFSEWGTP